MNFSEVVGEVSTITARPDKLAEISTAINFVISNLSLRAHFAKDLVESSITIDSTSYGATIPFDNVVPTSIVTRFRKFKYVKPYGVKGYLNQVGPDKIFTPGSITQLGVYYVAGNSITYTLKSLAPTLEIGYYQYPPTLKEEETYWMLDLMPYAVIDLAAARIFRSIGDDASAKIYHESGMDLFKAGRNDFEDSIMTEAR